MNSLATALTALGLVFSPNHIESLSKVSIEDSHSRPSSQVSWQLEDVSVLMPLELAGQNQLWSMQKQGQHKNLGPLIPQELQSGLENMDIQLLADLSNQEVLETLRVVSLSLDPCGESTTSTRTCQPQIRLLWQPVLQSGEQFSTQDVLLHSSYDLDPGQWRGFVHRYRHLIQKFNSHRPQHQALGVHSLLQVKDIRNEFIHHLSQIVLNSVGAKNLTRLTLSQMEPNTKLLSFLGLELWSPERGSELAGHNEALHMLAAAQRASILPPQEAKATTVTLWSLGYLQDQPAISQRATHESALSAELLNRMAPLDSL